jgi:hypothetical protein
MAIRRAKGLKSKAISDQSGFKIPYTSLKTQWDGLRVEPSEFDPKHPQLTPTKNIVDATSLFNPRPDNDDDLTVFTVGYNYDIFADKQSRPGIGIRSVGGVGSVAISAERVASGLGGTGRVGDGTDISPELSIDEAGVGGTGGVGSAFVPLVVSGVGSTGRVGDNSSIAPELSINEAGVGGTGGVGDNNDIDIETELAATGVAGSGATGNHGETNDEEIHLSIVESGVGGTGGVGDNSDIEPDLLGWGEGGWSSGTWGDG